MSDYDELKSPKKGKVGVSVRQDVIDHFKEIAERLDTSFSAVVQHVLLEQMKEDLEDETETKNEENRHEQQEGNSEEGS